jgi:hypothetical protein
VRPENWTETLADAVALASDQPFVWGQLDCCLFAADVVLAITGLDHAAEFRGHYSTAAGAKKALLRYGRGDIKETMTAKLGEPLPVLMACRGDFVLAATELGDSLGICMGATAAFKSPDGVAYLRLDQCLCAWRAD